MRSKYDTKRYEIVSAPSVDMRDKSNNNVETVEIKQKQTSRMVTKPEKN